MSTHRAVTGSIGAHINDIDFSSPQVSARTHWSSRQQSPQDGLDEDIPLEETSKRSGFGLPWCCVLRCPCCVLMLTLLLIGAICGVGIGTAETPELQTDFSTFMESDDDASLRWIAFSEALDNQGSAPSRRRLDEEVDVEEAVEGEAGLSSDGREPGREAPRKVDGARGTAERARGRRLRNLIFEERGMYITFTDTEGGNPLSLPMLQAMRAVEERLKALPEYQAVCDRVPEGDSRKWLCSRGLTFVNYVFPAQASSDPDIVVDLSFNGSGDTSILINSAAAVTRSKSLWGQVLPTAIANAQAAGDDVAGLATQPERGCSDQGSQCGQLRAAGQCADDSENYIYMRDFCAATCEICSDSPQTTAAPLSVQAVRAHFRFALLCCAVGDADVKAQLLSLRALWDKFLPALADAMEESEIEEIGKSFGQPGFRAWYMGNNLEGYLAEREVAGDLLWAIGSFSFVLVYATLHTRSVFLSLLGLFLILLSIPTALAIFFIVSGSSSISLMMLLAIFIIIGIGSDMIFVYTDFWKQSIVHTTDLQERVKFTYMQAASSTLATTFTTAMCFFSNLASVLRALREFGFFMGVTVTMAWLIVFLAYPSVLVLGDRLHKRILRLLTRSPKKAADKNRDSTMSEVMGERFRGSMVAVTSVMDPDKKGVGETFQMVMGARYATCLHVVRWCVVVIFVIGTLSAGLGGVLSMEQDPDPPQVFPPEHNVRQSEKWDRDFGEFDEDASAEARSDSGTLCSDIFASSCDVYHCRADNATVGSPSSCECYDHEPRDASSCENPQTYRVDWRLVSRGYNGVQTASQQLMRALFEQQFPMASEITFAGSGGPERATSLPLRHQHWESGYVRSATMHVMPLADVRLSPVINSTGRCAVKQVCYCSLQRCEAIGDAGLQPSDPVGTLTWPLIDTRRRLGGTAAEAQVEAQSSKAFDYTGAWSRRMQASSISQFNVLPRNQMDVVFVVGMEVAITVRLLGISPGDPFKFKDGFRMADPWTQRRLIEVCDVNKTALKIARRDCWIKDFRDHWLLSNPANEWPMKEIDDIDRQIANALQINAQVSELLLSDYLWWGDDGKVKATSLNFFLDVDKDIGADGGFDVKDAWDAYEQEFNSVAEGSLKGAFQTSNVWVRIEAEKVIIQSTIVTVVLSMGLVLLGIMFFTGSLHLALIVLAVVMSIIVCLFFFMVGIAKWKVGAVEVMCLIIFMGISVDYALHVAHKYHSCKIGSVEVLDQDEEADDVVEELPKMPERDTLMSGRDPTKGRTGRSASKDSAVSSRGLLSSFSVRHSQVNVHCVDDSVLLPCEDLTNEKKAMLRLDRGAERFERARYSLQAIGGAVAGSALTSMGSAVFMLPCTLVIFTKIGAVVLAVTVLAIVFSVAYLPAILMICGPCEQDSARLLRWMGQHCCPSMEDSEDEDGADDEMDRHYVLHMPARPISRMGSCPSATRTMILASG